MNLNTYLKTHFSSDLEKLPKQEPNDVLKKMFGNIYCFGDKEWTKAHTDLNSIAKERWTEFVFILFVEVLIDQNTYEHFRQNYPSSIEHTRLPKFGYSGLGLHNENPLVLIKAASDSELLGKDVLLDRAKECGKFCRQNGDAICKGILKIDTSDFWIALKNDNWTNLANGDPFLKDFLNRFFEGLKTVGDLPA
jgi:hypothetical protein